MKSAAVRIDEVAALGAIDHEADLARQRPHPARPARQVALRRLDQIVRGAPGSSRFLLLDGEAVGFTGGVRAVIDRGGAASLMYTRCSSSLASSSAQVPVRPSRPLSRMYPRSAIESDCLGHRQYHMARRRSCPFTWWARLPARPRRGRLRRGGTSPSCGRRSYGTSGAVRRPCSCSTSSPTARRASGRARPR